MTKVTKQNLKMKAWMTLASTDEQNELARLAETSRHQLYHIGLGLRTPSSGLAAKIEKASLEMSKRTKGRLPKLSRMDLSPVCAGCVYARQCKK